MVINSRILTPSLYKAALRETMPPLAKASGNLTLDQFFKLMYHTLDIMKPGVVFAPAWPQYLIPDTPEYKATMDNPLDTFSDTITYMVTRQEPGSVGGSKQPFSGMNRELTPRLREAVKVSDTKSRLVYGQWFDTLVQFDLWSLTTWEVEPLTTWFQRFMTTHRDFFKEMGLSEIYFWWRGQDKVSTGLRNKLHFRTLVYYIRVEEISYEEDYNLKQLKVQINDRITQEEA